MPVLQDRKILEALQTATLAAVAASSVPALPVQPVGRTITNDGKYVEIVFIPNNVNGEFWSEGKTYRGLYRLILHWTIRDEGVYEPMNLLQEFCSHFPVGAVFQKDGIQVKITQEPDFSGLIQSAPDLQFLVTIRYEAFQR